MAKQIGDLGTANRELTQGQEVRSPSMLHEFHNPPGGGVKPSAKLTLGATGTTSGFKNGHERGIV